MTCLKPDDFLKGCVIGVEVSTVAGSWPVIHSYGDGPGLCLTILHTSQTAAFLDSLVFVCAGSAGGKPGSVSALPNADLV